MKANETKVEGFLSSNKTQFVIPVYQRNYDWTAKECKQLLNDILGIGRTNNNSLHFIGSIVHVHEGITTSSRTTELVIIDGQQRLTTITLIYIALYWLAKEIDNKPLADDIYETYLTNRHVSESEKLKLRPTDNNDKALKYLLRADKDEEYTDYSRLVNNFRYFQTNIHKENYQDVRDGLNRLMFVEVALDRTQDNPQRIFESLNSTGLALSQSDLIRNYILMCLEPKEQQEIYTKYWEYIERLAKEESNNQTRVSDFIRDFLTLENKNIPNKGEVYNEFKKKYPTDKEQLNLTLAKLKSLVNFYNKLINPEKENDNDIKTHLKYIKHLQIEVTYPFLMKVYEDYANKIISKADFIQLLQIVQSYAWRRFIVGLPTNALNKVFMTLYDKIDLDNYIISVQRALLEKKGNQKFPRNDEVENALKLKDVYNIQPKNRTYFLERLENFKNNESVQIHDNENITIEHIFPQNPSPKWKIEMNDEAAFNEMKNIHLHTIANLTLVGHNSSLGNKTFQEKKELKDVGYESSRLWLNKYLSTIEKWDVETLENRFQEIRKRFFEIWEIPSIVVRENNETEINIFDAEDPTNKKLEYAIFFDEIIITDNFAIFYVKIMKKLFELDSSLFFETDLKTKIASVNDTCVIFRQSATISEHYVIDTHSSSSTKFKIIKQALELFEFEDELFIKYVNETKKTSLF